MRDDFGPKTKRLLAERVGYKCSNPFCRITTIGPQEGDNGTVNVGEASHIYAAAPGGKRYNADMTSEQRTSYENGIWLCRTHAAHIDRDEKYFTVEMLSKWKEDAERMAANEILQNNENLRKCSFRMNIFYNDFYKYKETMNLFHMKRGISVDTSYIPIQQGWEDYLQDISNLIGPEVTAVIYNIMREIQEFKLIMEKEIERQHGRRLSDMGTVRYCNRCDIFVENMDNWLTQELLDTMKLFIA